MGFLLPPFTDEETEAKGGIAICPESPMELFLEPGVQLALPSAGLHGHPSRTGWVGGGWAGKQVWRER